MKALPIALGAGLVIALGIYIKSADTIKPGVVVSQRAAQLPQTAHTADTAAAISPQPAPVQRAQVTPRSITRASPQSAQFFESSDLKQIVDDARKNPAAGSFYYATLALRECDNTTIQRISAVEGAENMGGPKREAMIEKAQQRCRNVTAADIAALRQLGDEGLAANDSAFAVVAPLSSKRIAQGAPELIDALYGRSDAGVMLTVLSQLALRSDFLQVHGRQMTEAERSSLPAALMLLGCDMGVPCDDRHPLVRVQCIGHGSCDAQDLSALVQRSDIEFWRPYSRGNRFDYQAALALKNELADSITRGDRSALRYFGN